MQFEVKNGQISAVIFQDEHYYRKVASGSVSSASSKSSIKQEVDKGPFVGFYERKPVENDWHHVEICLDEDNELIWKNEAGKSWKLDFDGDKLAKSDNDEYDAQVRN